MRLTDKMKDDERHIIQRILRGETALYEHFLNTYGQQVFILVARIVSNQEDAEELKKKYDKGYITKATLKGWVRIERKVKGRGITEEQYEQITGEKYEA